MKKRTIDIIFIGSITVIFAWGVIPLYIFRIIRPSIIMSSFDWLKYIMFIIYVVAVGVGGIGVLLLKNWARILLIVISSIAILHLCFKFLPAGGFIVFAFSIILPLLFLYILARPEIDEQFKNNKGIWKPGLIALTISCIIAMAISTVMTVGGRETEYEKGKRRWLESKVQDTKGIKIGLTTEKEILDLFGPPHIIINNVITKNIPADIPHTLLWDSELEKHKHPNSTQKTLVYHYEYTIQVIDLWTHAITIFIDIDKANGRVVALKIIPNGMEYYIGPTEK